MIGPECPGLEGFYSREDKLRLLDEAIERHDGNAITRIILWLKETLKWDADLMKELMNRASGLAGRLYKNLAYRLESVLS